MSEQRRWLQFTNPRVSEILLEWWGTLDQNRGERADLRRCKTTEDVAFVPAYHRLRKALLPLGEVNDRSLCTVAGVLSHVRENDGSGSFAAQLARIPPGRDAPLMSELRFRRFISIRDPELLYREAIRAVRILDGIVNITDLAQGLYWWTPETRKKWTFEYFEKIA
ncbi:MAG: type I-E CRISPR-associated protein Cse2/CasB [Methanolinea sp.]|nr:type I-E CRISPR-associated protein Cse2/CasB [Methanolinea sp.]